MVAGDERSDTDTDSEADERCSHDGARTGCGVNHGGVILRDVHNLRVSRLNDVNGLRTLLHLDLQLLIAAQSSGGIGLRAQPLN
jgi:hypothetical protein